MSLRPSLCPLPLALLALALVSGVSDAPAQTPLADHGTLAQPAAALKAGDALEILVKSETSDFTLAAYVSRDGSIDLAPFNGVVEVGGLPLKAASQRVTAALKAQLPAPEATLRLITLGEGAYFITGDIRVPGSHPARPGLMVRQAVLESASQITSWCLSSGTFRLFESCSARISIARPGSDGDVKCITTAVSPTSATGREAVRAGDLISVRVDVDYPGPDG